MAAIKEQAFGGVWGGGRSYDKQTGADGVERKRQMCQVHMRAIRNVSDPDDKTYPGDVPGKA